MKNKKIIVVVLISFLAGALFAGACFFAYNSSKKFVKKAAVKLEKRRIANIPRAKTPLALCDFESPQDLKKWTLKNARLERSKENSTEGEFSAKVYLQKGGSPAIKLETFFKENRDAANWEKYEAVSFDIFNPSESRQGIIVQIKDNKDNRYKKSFGLMPLANNHIEVAVADLHSHLDASHITIFQLFLWKPKEDKVFFIDNVKLLPSAQFEKRTKSMMSSEFIPKTIDEIYKTGYYFDFSKNKQKWLRQGSSTYIEVPLYIKNNSEAHLENFPVTGGIPFPRGELKSENQLVVVDSEGREMPIQTKTLGTWPDKSVKWLLLNMEESLTSQEETYFLKYSSDIKRQKINTPLHVTENRSILSVVTGPLKFSLDKNKFNLFDRVWLDKNSDGIFSDSEIISQGGDLVLVHNGREYRSSLDKDYKLEIEKEGPLKVGLKASGWFTSSRGKRFCQFIIRIKAFKDKSYVKVDHTFIYTGYPENKYHHLYKGKRLPRNETIDAIYIETPLNLSQTAKYAFELNSEIIEGGLNNSVDLFQEDTQKFIAFEKKEKLVREGRMAGWVDLSSDEAGLTVFVKDFWQQFPKGYRLDKEKKLLITEIWPKKAGELDFKTTQAAHGPGAVARGSAFGVAKTHTIVFYFHKGDFKAAKSQNIARGFSEDILIRPAAEWIADSRVLGRLTAAGLDFQLGEEFLDKLFSWAERQKKDFKWYGMIDFGDTLSWYRKEAYDKSYNDWGWHPEGRSGWFNCEAAGTHTGALLQYLRTGSYKYFRFGRDLARHIMDVDTCHYNTVANDKRLKGRIPDDYSQVGSMHRHNGDHWGGRNEEAAHTNLVGIMLYYYITGDDRARDVLDEIGSFFLQERVTYFGHPNNAPQRSIANVLWGDVLMYELTGDFRYKEHADKLAELFYVGQLSNGAWLEKYDPEADRWKGKPKGIYTAYYTLPALIEYHKQTGNKAIADCIVKGTEYLSNNAKYEIFFDALAYSYWLTQDKKFLDEGTRRLRAVIKRQKKKEDPIWNGMLYSKPYYLRPATFLYSVPWIFEALQEKRKKEKI